MLLIDCRILKVFLSFGETEEIILPKYKYNNEQAKD